MIGWLAGIWIPEDKNYELPETRKRYGVLCGIAGIVLNLFLFAGKLLAGFFSHSIAIMADALNNLSDAGSSLIMLLGFRIAGQRPDRDHPFGHGRMEYLSGLFVAIAIMLMAVELIQGSVEKIFHPEETNFSWLVIIILVSSILVKLYMYSYNRAYGKRIGSAAMLATATDSVSDAVATGVVLISALVSKFAGLRIDSWCGLLVGLFILSAGIRAAKDTIDPLLGQPADEEFVRRVEEIVLAREEIRGMHDLVVHNYGPGRIMLSLHAEVPADGSLVQLHEVIDEVENYLSEQLRCEAVIHMDPVFEGDEEVCRMGERMRELLTQIDKELSLHDFRIVKQGEKTKLLFDVVAPYQFPWTDEELTGRLAELAREENPHWVLSVKVDRK